MTQPTPSENIAAIREAVAETKNFLLIAHNMGKQVRAENRLTCSKRLTDAMMRIDALEATIAKIGRKE